ncbi:juvenile hormone esterase isoform X2 [Spodoptera frugiperda]|uniref:Carboxylic ester hydrolase n=1 Tax=Spodoptera frugiperda TaxID=7108 RepID=A0A9R0EPU9_SPOFR|nr:juvenile hormone esterase isoform X2 [Spodoptera frugiperda]
MTTPAPYLLALLLLLPACTAHVFPAERCRVRAFLESGTVCGVERLADGDVKYASFRGVPYAKQPLGELRFKELEPAEPWDYHFATDEGPVCYQHDVLYGRLMRPQGMSESCIHANIHVPMEALPDQHPDVTLPGLPILVFIHGGGFGFGSGDADLHGPEYLVSKKVIVITFNYRLNVFGFLSMNTTAIPGNGGLRDQVTLLRWVQRNARAFGGDPTDVTLAGQSAGAVAAHLLSLSPAAEGLFRRAILMSGTATSPFYSASPAYAQLVRNMYLQFLGITSTDPEDIQRQLIELPAERLNAAHTKLIDQMGLVTFGPTVESPLPGVTTIIDDDPEALLNKGRGKNIPLIVGYTNSECETFRNRFEAFDLIKKIASQSILVVPPKLLFATPQESLSNLVSRMFGRYFNGKINMDGFVKSCSEGFYEYPALKLAQKRAELDGTPVYLYQFTFDSPTSVIKEVMGLSYQGAAHIEDLTYVFKANSVLEGREGAAQSLEDLRMKNFMTDLIVQFMACSKPICDDKQSLWPEDNGNQIEVIEAPGVLRTNSRSPSQLDVLDFFDSLHSRVNAV